VNQLDATDRDNGGFDEQLYGHYHGVMNMTVHYNEADAGQEQIRDALEGKTTLIGRWRTHGTEGAARQTAGTITVESKGPDSPMRDTSKETYVLHFSTTPTFDTQ